MDSEPGKKTTGGAEGLAKDVSELEERLRGLGLDEKGTLSLKAQNDVRSLMRRIENQVTTSSSSASDFGVASTLQDVLKVPLLQFQDHSAVTDENVSKVLALLRLFSEICPSPSQSGVGGESFLSRDVVWSEILESVYPDILRFLNVCVFERCWLALSSSTQSPSESCNSGTGFAFHQQLGVLLKGVRILLIYLKRATIHVAETNPLVCEEIVNILETHCRLMNPQEENSKVVFDIGLDIRCNIGVAICYSIFYLRHPNSDEVGKFFRYLFSDNKQIDFDLTETEGNICKLVTIDVNRIALAVGVLNTWLEQQSDKELHYTIGKTVLDMHHGVQEAVSLGAARVLEIWIEKLTRPSVFSENLHYAANLFDQLEFFCFLYMPGHIDAVKNCCRNILSSVSRIYDRLDDENFTPLFQEPGVDQGRRSWVLSLLQSSLEQPDHIKWIALACISKNTKKALQVLLLDPKFTDSLLQAPRTFKNAANETYVSLMSYHFEATTVENWEKTWIAPLFTTQLGLRSESNWVQKKNIISIILNSEKTRVPHLQVMIAELLKSVVARMNSGPMSSSDEDTLAETSLLGAETIKMAYELKISIDSKNGSNSRLQDDDSFRGLVPRTVLHNWLWSESPQIRLAGFALLVETKKTSEIIPANDLLSLKILLKYNLHSQNPAFRQHFFSYFKKLLRRLKDGTAYAQRSKDKDILQRYEEFLCWLWNFLTVEEGLFYGANFGRRCQALECLTELTQYFTDFTVFGVTSEGNTKYLSWLTDTYENNKTQALEVLVRMPIKEMEDDTFCEKLFDEAMSLCKSVKPPESVTGRYLMTLLMRKCSARNEKFTAWRILQSLFKELQQMRQEIDNTSLIHVSSTSPFYGCIRCIRMILQNTNEFKQQEHSLNYRDFIEKLLALCFDIDDIVFPVLGCAAPEGFLPELTESSQETKPVVRSLAAQMLLVCAWRTMKEICLMMSDMCSLFVMEGETVGFDSGKHPKPTAEFILSFDQVSRIGDHLLYLLKNLMHRGVFEQVFVGFKVMANRLWRSSNPQLSSLPEKWLQEAMDQEHISAKSITRRSGGLPFIFQALLSSESDNETFLHKWLTRLFIIDDDPELTPIRIHSMNVLRGLFRDSCFSAAMMPFVPHGLKMAFRGLKSTDWTERNSGLMLYGAVMRRSFGAKLNLMNAPSFFRKFPQMYDFLLGELDICIDRLNTRNTVLTEPENAKTRDFTFHLLLLLSSFTSCGRVEDTHFKLAEFIPRVRKCGESDDMEVRKLAAKALLPFLVTPEDKRQLAIVILNLLKSELKMPKNLLHGLLLQFLNITRQLKLDDLSGSKESNTMIVEMFVSYLSLEGVLESYRAPSLYETVMDILVALQDMNTARISGIYTCASSVEESYHACFCGISNRHFVPGLPVADYSVARAILLIGAENLETLAFFETLFTYFKYPTKYNIYVNQFFELCQEEFKFVSLFRGAITDEIIVVLDAVVESYLEQSTTVFKKFPGTQLETNYLRFLFEVPAEAYEFFTRDNSELLKQFLQKLFNICGEEEFTTLQVKALAFTIIGNIAFGTAAISEFDQNKLCDIMLQWSGSGMDDDMRFAVATILPAVSFQNMKSFSIFNQAQIWGSVFLLAQDDVNYLRQVVNVKICGADKPCCDRKALEILTATFVQDFLQSNTTEGLSILIGLLLRENFEVEAKAADDETEDRLFDKSEMNMYFEHLTLAKVFRVELESADVALKQRLKSSIDSPLTNSQLKLLGIISERPELSPSSETVSLRKLLDCNSSLFDDAAKAQVDSKNNCIVTKIGNPNVIKLYTQKILGELLKNLDQNV